MELKDILAKIAKGDALTDEEKKFAGEFNLQTLLDSAASSARKKAEAETKAAKDALAKAQADFDAYREANDPDKGKTELARLNARLEKLEAARKAAEDKASALERTARIRTLAKEAGVNPAKGVDSKTIDLLVDHLMAEVDLDDADAVKAAFDGFKSANAGLIAANTVGGAGAKGTPGGGFAGPNPFSQKTFNLTKQLELQATQPELAKSLEAAAAAEG